MADQHHEDYLTPAEIAVQLEQLSRADLKRLEQISSYVARSTQDAQDLRQEAYSRVLEGSRRCSRDQDLIHCLAGAMQSIQNAKWKAAARLKPHKEAFEQELGVTAPPSAPDPLEALLEQENEFRFAMGKLKLFGDDPVAMTIVEGIMEGFEGAELCELAGITPQELATKRRLIKRRLDKAGGLTR